VHVVGVREFVETGRPNMASSGKRKTTMAKMNRERRLIERRLDKQARKDARKRASADHASPSDDRPTDNDS
jgi:hypothetical protein